MARIAARSRSRAESPGAWSRCHSWEGPVASATSAPRVVPPRGCIGASRNGHANTYGCGSAADSGFGAAAVEQPSPVATKPARIQIAVLISSQANVSHRDPHTLDRGRHRPADGLPAERSAPGLVAL